jgi:hypothetical protein
MRRFTVPLALLIGPAVELVEDRQPFALDQAANHDAAPEPSGPLRVIPVIAKEIAVRRKLIAVASGLMLGCLATAALAQCDDKSQQNAADEAAVRGDLAAGSKCADAADAIRSEKKNEEAAERAKASIDDRSGQHRNSPSSGARPAPN